MAEMSHPEASAEGSSQANANESQEVSTTKDEGTKDPRPVYEVGFHVVPTVEEAQVSGVAQVLHKELAKHDAEVIKEQAPQKMALAYTIERRAQGKREKYSEAYFGFIKFAMEREAVTALEALLRSTPEILRYLLVETVREEPTVSRRAVFTSSRLEGETIKKPTSTPEAGGEVSEEDLDKSIEAIVS